MRGNRDNRMKKIGILTFHRANNYGAVLQSYALFQVVHRECNEVEIINYQNSILESQYKLISRYIYDLHHPKLFIKNIFMIGHRYKTIRFFNEFRKEHLCIGDLSYNENKPPEKDAYNAIIAGSDQIWNMKCNGNDSNYFLKFTTEKLCLCYSYAASLGIEMLDEEQKSFFMNMLKPFKKISVREKKSEVLLQPLAKVPVKTCIDPTFLLEKSEWRKIEIEPMKKRYVLVFLMTHSNIILKNALEFSKSMGMEMVYINLFEPFISHKYNSLYSVKPEEWIGYIDCAEYIITNSFHGTAFALIFEKNFTSYLISDKGRNERIIQILQISDLMNHLSYEDAPVKVYDIDYKKVNSKLRAEKENSRVYLAEIIDDIKSNLYCEKK